MKSYQLIQNTGVYTPGVHAFEPDEEIPAGNWSGVVETIDQQEGESNTDFEARVTARCRKLDASL